MQNTMDSVEQTSNKHKEKLSESTYGCAINLNGSWRLVSFGLAQQLRYQADPVQAKPKQQNGWQGQTTVQSIL